MRRTAFSFTNVSADTRYYPTHATAGRGTRIGDDAEELSLQFVVAGGSTLTVEATMGDADDAPATTETWVDITSDLQNAITGSKAANYVDTSGLLYFPRGLLVRRVRVKIVTADASNSGSGILMVRGRK